MNWSLLQYFLVAGEVNLGNRPKRKPIVPSGVFGMVVFIITEVMFFSGLVSAYLIIRAGLEEWPPWGQPRLPIESTAFNTLLLIISAFEVDSISDSIASVELSNVTHMFSPEIQGKWSLIQARPAGQLDLLIGANVLGLHPVDLALRDNLRIKKSKF